MLKLQNQINVQKKNQVQVSITWRNRIVCSDKGTMKYKIN